MKKKPELRFAYFLTALPVDDFIPLGAAHDNAIVEGIPSNPENPVTTVFTASFQGVSKRHRVLCRVYDPSGTLVWDTRANSPKGDEDTIWATVFEIRFVPESAPCTFTLHLAVDGDEYLTRLIEVVPKAEISH